MMQTEKEGFKDYLDHLFKISEQYKLSNWHVHQMKICRETAKDIYNLTEDDLKWLDDNL